MKRHLVIGSLLLGTLALTACSKQEIEVSGSYSAFLQGMDWGESLSRVTLKLDKTIDAKSVSIDDFEVSETKEVFSWATADKGVYKDTLPRELTSAYVSDKAGKEISSSSEYITLEFTIGPNEGRYFLTAPGEQFTYTQYPTSYQLNISLKDDSNLSSKGQRIKKLTINSKVEELSHSANRFKIGEYSSSDGIDYQYAHYEPAEGSDTLVVWLHGISEGGSENTDPYITLLGNEAAILGEEDFQKTIGGANVLVPQSPNFWMDTTGSDKLVDGRIISNGTSHYMNSLHELIAEYREKTGSKKVIIAGCSNGGFMGMALALEYGAEYNAYMLLCEAMEDRFITDNQIEKLKTLPLYFVYSTQDPLVVPQEYELPTIERLKKAGATSVQVAELDTIVDTSGTIKDEAGNAFDFGGHSVWVPFFNNEVESDQGISAWNWLKQQID